MKLSVRKVNFAKMVAVKRPQALHATRDAETMPAVAIRVSIYGTIPHIVVHAMKRVLQVKFAKTDIARPSVCVEKVKSVTPTAPVSHHVVAKLAQKMPSAATNPAFPAMPKIIAVLVKMPVPVKHQFALTARVSPNVTTRRR